MEPENHGFQKDFPTFQGLIFRFHVKFRGCIKSQAFSRTDACVRLGWVVGWSWCLVISPTNAMVEGVGTSAFCWRWQDFFCCVLVLFYLGMANWQWNHHKWYENEIVVFLVNNLKNIFFGYSHHGSVEISSLLKYVVWTRELCEKKQCLKVKLHLALTMQLISRWWFQLFFYFHPYLGKISMLTNIFQMGWNHQPDMFELLSKVLLVVVIYSAFVQCLGALLP